MPPLWGILLSRQKRGRNIRNASCRVRGVSWRKQVSLMTKFEPYVAKGARRASGGNIQSLRLRQELKS